MNEPKDQYYQALPKETRDMFENDQRLTKVGQIWPWKNGVVLTQTSAVRSSLNFHRILKIPVALESGEPYLSVVVSGYIHR